MRFMMGHRVTMLQAELRVFATVKAPARKPCLVKHSVKRVLYLGNVRLGFVLTITSVAIWNAAPAAGPAISQAPLITANA